MPVWRREEPQEDLFLRYLHVDETVPEIIFPVVFPNFPEYAAGVSDSHHACGDILGDNAPGSDNGIITDGNTGQDDSARPDPDIAADMNVDIILQALPAQMRLHRMAGSRDGHIGADHHTFAHIDMAVIHKGEVIIRIHVSAEMHVLSAEIGMQRRFNIAVCAYFSKHVL